MKFFDNLSETSQIILTMVVMAVLFLAVTANNRRNKKRYGNRRGKSFRENIKSKRKDQES